MDDSDGSSKKTVPANPKSTKSTNEEPANKLKSPASSEDTRNQKLPRTNDFNLGLGWTGNEETGLSAIFKAPRKSRTGIASGSAKSSMIQEPMKNREERQGGSEKEITAKSSEKQKPTGSGDGSVKKTVPPNPKSTKRTNEEPSNKLPRTNDFNLGLGWTNNEETGLEAIFKAPRKSRTGIASGSARSSTKNKEGQGGSEMEIREKNYEKQKSSGSGDGSSKKTVPANPKSTKRTNEEPANKLKSPASSEVTRSQKLPRTNDFNLGLGWTGNEETGLEAIFKAPRKSRTGIASGSARSSMIQEPMKNREERQGGSEIEITAKSSENQKSTGSGEGLPRREIPDLNLPVNEEIVQLFGISINREPKNTRSSKLAPAGREAPAPQPVVNPPPVGPFFLTLQPNEEICTSLRSIAQQHPDDVISVTSAHGSLRSIQIFSESTRQTTNYEGPRTIVSFTGTNYLIENGGTFSKILLVAGEGYDIFGGELERAIVDEPTTVQFITFPRNLLG